MTKNSQCPRIRINTKFCTCTHQGCPKHGLCCECIHYHRQRRELPACYFTEDEERSFNRSIEFFVQRRTPK